MTERWKRIPGTPYSVSSWGAVRRTVGGQGARAGKILEPRRSGGRGGNDYLYVCLSYDGRREEHLVHVLVAEAFLGERPTPWAVVDHRDGKKTHNHLRNLQWVSRAENYRRWAETKREEAAV